MSESAFNTFTELNTDTHALNAKNTVMVDAINAALTTKGHNQLILQNMEGTEAFSKMKENYKPLAVGVYQNIAYIVSGLFDADGTFVSGEIGTFPSPDWSVLNAQNPVDSNYFVPIKQEYSPLMNFSHSTVDAILNLDTAYVYNFNTPEFNFLAGRLLEIELQPSYDDSVNIIITDDYNPPRLINSRFRMHESGKKAAIADRRQKKDTNTYSDARFGATRLIKRSDIIPDLVFKGVEPGGSHMGGGYRFFFKYTDSDGSLTDIIEESRLVVMAYDDHGATDQQNTNKKVTFELTNLDTKFSGVKVFFSHASGVVDTSTLVYEINNIYDISADTITIVIFGNEQTTLIDADTLNLDYSSISTVKTITQYDDRLLLGNVSNNTEAYDEFKYLAALLTIEEVTKDMKIRTNDFSAKGYGNPENVYKNLGYWDGESYEVGIVFILTEGRGLTPAFPTRGIDNYNSNGTYTSYYNPNQFGADGFKNNTFSENRLGVFRTSATRKMLFSSNPSAAEGTDGNADSTTIKYFRVDVAELLLNDEVQKNTTGFFFVRKERKRDCIVQGYICNTVKVPVASKISSTRYDVATTSTEWDNNEQAHIQDLSASIGRYFNTLPLKILPAPGRIWESHVDITDQSVTWNRTVCTQGKVSPGVDWWDAEPTATNEQYFSFYAADQLADPAIMATTFNSTNKGIMVNRPENVVKAWSYVSDHNITTSTLLSGNGNTEIVNDGANDKHYTFVFKSTTKVTIHSPNPNTQVFTITDASIVYDAGVAYGNKLIDGTLTFTINDTFLGPAALPISSGLWTITPGGNSTNVDNGYFPLPVIGYCNPLNLAGSSTQTLNLNITGGGNFKSEGNNIVWQGLVGQSNIALNVSKSTIQSIFVSPAKNTPIKQLNLRNHNFNPVLITGPNPDPSITTNTAKIQYVGAGQQAYTNNQFAASEDRNLYYAISKQANTDNSSKWLNNMISTGYDNEPTNTIQKAQLIMTSNTQFSEYMGITMKRLPVELIDPLKNDDVHVYSEQIFATNPNGLTGTDWGDYTYQLQDTGFNLGSLANIYEDPSGVTATGTQWKSRYTNSGYTDTYFAVTKRYKWADFPTTSTAIDIFDGDCYIGMVYKRIMYGLGIPGVPTASDPSAYTDFNQSTGLFPRGFVMPIVTQNNYNVNLRTFDNYLASEKAIYGKDRSFFPVDNIDALRSSRQPESTGYNHGYDWDFSDRSYATLNDRAPSLNINYGNRVMVSATSVSGNFSNGYIDFSGLNFRDYNKQLGQITRLISHNNTVYCIFEQGVGVLPINQRTMVSQAQGGVFLDNASVLAPKMQIVSTEYGSDQQFSIIKTDQAVYGCDLKKNKIWRVGGASDSGFSLDLISDFAVQSVLIKFKERIIASNANNFVKANYDRERNHVIFSYMNEENGNYTTDYLSPDPSKVVYVEPGNGTTKGTETLTGSELEGGSFFEKIRDTQSEAAKYLDDTVTPQRDNPESFTDGGRVPAYYEKEINEVVLTPVPQNPWENGTYEDPSLIKTPFNNYIRSTNNVGSIYWNETIQKWVSKLSWTPIWMFNIENNLYSFDATAEYNAVTQTGSHTIWKHFSDKVPYSHFYGYQDKFIFEFVLVDKSTVQKILNNLMLISNRTFPSKISYTLLENDVDYDSLADANHSYEELMKQRHERAVAINPVTTNWATSKAVLVGTLPNIYIQIQDLSLDESNRLQGGTFVYGNKIYRIGQTYSPNMAAGPFYNELLDQNDINITAVPTVILDANGNPIPLLSVVDFGIIKQNMEYIEDHLYTEVGKGSRVVTEKDANGNITATRLEDMGYVRDKAIKIKITYEGYEYVNVQAVISSFVYSFN